MQKNIDKIKQFAWENRVYRTGFLQSKSICNEAELEEVVLTGHISVGYDNVFWVQNYNLYDDEKTKTFPLFFEKAFVQDKYWPKKHIDLLDKSASEIQDFISETERTDFSTIESKKKEQFFLRYVKLLKSVQKYYNIAVPLTRYAESLLGQYPDIIQEYATPFRNLEVDGLFSSENPLQEYAWVKTAYNIVEKLEASDIEKKEKNSRVELVHTALPEEIQHIVEALQIGIYIRNRIKELAQKLWYYIEPLAKSMAKDLGISRNEFFYLTYSEVIDSLQQNSLVISKKELEKRTQFFAIGFLGRGEIILSGQVAKGLIDYFGESGVESDTISGRTAYAGHVSGRVSVLMDRSDFKKFKKGNILVTAMTTPDFVVLMSKAKAIVTDEGGLSCHAAIVSRELGIPCVIGTKIATKVLKDGDMVEVDANRGIVKKI